MIEIISKENEVWILNIFPQYPKLTCFWLIFPFITKFLGVPDELKLTLPPLHSLGSLYQSYFFPRDPNC